MIRNIALDVSHLREYHDFQTIVTMTAPVGKGHPANVQQESGTKQPRRSLILIIWIIQDKFTLRREANVNFRRYSVYLSRCPWFPFPYFEIYLPFVTIVESRCQEGCSPRQGFIVIKINCPVGLCPKLICSNLDEMRELWRTRRYLNDEKVLQQYGLWILIAHLHLKPLIKFQKSDNNKKCNFLISLLSANNSDL